eukprot:COSAG01_NODE_48372_length_382_cov_0.522968_1_plen_108_part_01
MSAGAVAVQQKRDTLAYQLVAGAQLHHPHAYVAIVWSNTRADEYTAENVAAMVGSMAYVRNWHGFGLGSERSDLLASGDPEERLMRFLQAQGIDTTDVAAGSLEQFMK